MFHYHVLIILLLLLLHIDQQAETKETNSSIHIAFYEFPQRIFSQNLTGSGDVEVTLPMTWRVYFARSVNLSNFTSKGTNGGGEKITKVFPSFLLEWKRLKLPTIRTIRVHIPLPVRCFPCGLEENISRRHRGCGHFRTFPDSISVQIVFVENPQR